MIQKEKVVLQVMQEPQNAAERNNESEGDSEYEDAEDGILSATGSSPTQAATNFECRICGESVATKFCKECKDTFCPPCDGLYHKHASRQHHVRTELRTGAVSPSRQQPAVSAATAAPTAATPTPATNAAAKLQQSQGAAAASALATASNEMRYDLSY